jgi:hypothetical protein
MGYFLSLLGLSEGAVESPCLPAIILSDLISIAYSLRIFLVSIIGTRDKRI